MNSQILAVLITIAGSVNFERQDRTAVYALTVLTFINLFNYVDRWVVAALLESLRRSELHLTDIQLGLLPFGFLFVYTLMSPVFGTLGDRLKRPPLIAIGVALWSIATALAGFAHGLASARPRTERSLPPSWRTRFLSTVADGCYPYSSAPYRWDRRPAMCWEGS